MLLVLDLGMLVHGAELLVAECSAGHFNAQSTSVAWWAVSKLICASHPLASQLFLALETALLGCLAMPADNERPNSQVGVEAPIGSNLPLKRGAWFETHKY